MISDYMHLELIDGQHSAMAMAKADAEVLSIGTSMGQALRSVLVHRQ